MKRHSEERFNAIVAGAGAAGLMGALVAAHHGANVLLLDRDLTGESNFLVSGGLFPAAGSRYQRAAGIADSPALLAADVRAKGGADVNEAILDIVAARTVDAIDFLADVIGLDLHVMANITAPGHSVPRLHATPRESGRELHGLMRKAAGAHPRIRMIDDAQATGLLVSEHATRVIGLRARVAGAEQSYEGDAVLLATGGFAGNRALLAEFIPEMARALHIGAGPNDGCGISWGRALGADVALMDGYQGQGHVNPGKGTRLGMALPPLGAFMVNRHGVRFVNEDIGPSELGAVVLSQPGGVALEVFDQRILDIVMKQGPVRDAWAAGAVIEGPGLSEIAQKAGVPLEALSATFDAFARAARDQGGDPLGRTRFAAPLAPPLYASWVTGALAHTQGGLAVDANARVLRADRSVIPGLYAAGGVAAGLSGRGGAGYLPGNGLGQSFPLALIAGIDMAQAARNRG
jgi:fumarate reductase flavoprotein subunit